MIESVILRNGEGNDLITIIPQLCISLNCLPSEIEKEDYNSISNVIATLIAQNKKHEKEKNKLTRK